MYVTLIINRGTINITNPQDIRSGTSELLSAGDQKITFDLAYSDTDYDLIIDVYNANGIRSGYILGAKEADGFNINLSYDSYVHYVANKS